MTGNQGFVDKAPAKLVEAEKAKFIKFIDILDQLQTRLDELRFDNVKYPFLWKTEIYRKELSYEKLSEDEILKFVSVCDKRLYSKPSKRITKAALELRNNFLENLPVRFYMQVALGEQIVDFYCPAAKLIVKVGGPQCPTEESIPRRNSCDEALSSFGLKVLHISNKEASRCSSRVKQKICEYL